MLHATFGILAIIALIGFLFLAFRNGSKVAPSSEKPETCNYDNSLSNVDPGSHHDSWYSSLGFLMDDSEQMSRAEMIKARADIKRQITKLSYSPIIGGGGGATSPRPALIARLKKTLVEIDEKLAKTDAADNA